jgi:multidrug efflux system membrane fusion protein
LPKVVASLHQLLRAGDAHRIVKENNVFAPKILRRTVSPSLLVALADFAAGRLFRRKAKVEDIRPVRAIVLSASNVTSMPSFRAKCGRASNRGWASGSPAKSPRARSIRARGQARPGADAARSAGLAPVAGRFQGRPARAAETTRDLAKAELKRYQELRVKNFVSQAVLDQKLAALQAAQANVDAAQAGYFGQSNQAGYATLVADVDGVVTAVDAEVGQVVAPGTPVVRVAKTNEKEIVIGLPEDKVDTLRKVADVTVRLWANPNVAIPGKIREVSPVADGHPHLRRQGVDSRQRRSDVKLGMTALVQFSSTTTGPADPVPLTALFYEKRPPRCGWWKTARCAWCRCRWAAPPAMRWCWWPASSPARPS